MEEQNNIIEEGKTNRKGYGELIIPLIIAAFIISYWTQTEDVAFISLIFPGIISIGMILMVLFISINALRRNGHKSGESNLQETSISKKMKKESLYRFIFLGFILIAILLFNMLGAFISLILLSISTMLLLGVRKIIPLILFPLIFVFSIIFIFETYFHFYLPKGILG